MSFSQYSISIDDPFPTTYPFGEFLVLEDAVSVFVGGEEKFVDHFIRNKRLAAAKMDPGQRFYTSRSSPANLRLTFMYWSRMDRRMVERVESRFKFAINSRSNRLYFAIISL